MEAEFDRYAGSYPDLLRDPIRGRFAAGERFYHQRKWDVLSDWAASLGFDLAEAEWLDAGCGQGELLRIGRSFVRRAIGCDPSAGMLAGAAGVEVIRQEAPDRLPLDDSCVDLVTAVCVYHHVEPELRGVLTREVFRVLRPGGLFAIVEHNPLNPVTRAIVRRLPVDAGARLLGARTALGLMRRSGFRPVGRRYFLVVPERFFGRLGRCENALMGLPLGGQYAAVGSKPGAGQEARRAASLARIASRASMSTGLTR
jgi:SAM-dependent methyltransferase